MIVVIKIIITNNNIDNHKSELFFGQLLMLLDTNKKQNDKDEKSKLETIFSNFCYFLCWNRQIELIHISTKY